jgi:cobalt-zinc-cadmium efflux system outer membrane protein
MRLVLTLVVVFSAQALTAQQPVSRTDAVAAALARGARVALGRADTVSARGAVRAARAFPNPTVSGSYTKDTPNYHALGDLPLDLPWLRSPRIGAAEAARDAARYRFVYQRAAIRFDVDTTYTRSLATGLRARLSRRTADDADSLLKIAELRRDVGDVSELDVRLAAVNAGQLANVALDDSLTALTTLLSLQLQMGLSGDLPTITLSDSLATPADSATGPTAGELLPVAAAAASLRSAERALTLARASRFAPSIEFGVDKRDPGLPNPNQLLPVIGFSLPLPLFNWSGGNITRAAAERDRARAELDLTRRETEAAVSRARRELSAARERLRRSAALVASADRVAAMSLQAYSEGAIALANVLEAQRNAREILARYIDDLGAADTAARLLRWLTTSLDQP